MLNYLIFSNLFYMRTAIIFTILFSAIGFSQLAEAQDNVLLLNGKYKNVDVKRIIGDYVIYEKPNSGNIRSIAKEDVYSIGFKDSAQVIYYRQDDAIGNTLSQEQMYSFILGEQDARTHFKAPLITAGGFVSGAAGGAGFISQTLGVLVPAVYAGVVGMTNTKVNENKLTDKESLKDEYFVSGYQYVASKKKVNNALIGGVIGFAISAVAVSIIKD